MAIAIELRTTCERCRDPLPLNAWSTAVPCWACLHENPISPEQWAQLLRGAIADAWTLEEGEGRSETLKVGARKFELRFSTVDKPRGKRRARPKEMRADLFPGVAALAGEEHERPDSTEHQPFHCPQCGAARDIDGRSRSFTCSHCNTTSQLSDEVWRRMHPVHAQRPWYLVLNEEAGVPEREGAPPTELSIEHDGDIIVGPDGLLYATAAIDGKQALVCMDAALVLRWRSDVKLRPIGGARLAIVGDELWLAQAARHEVRRFARADGKELGKLGGPEPEGASVHHLDLRGLSELVGCPDGTVLALVCHRLVRYDASGKGIPTWPPVKGFWSWLSKVPARPLYSGPPVKEDRDSTTPERLHTMPDSDELGHDRVHATLTMHTRAVAGPGGELSFHDGQSVHRYGPDGKHRWTTRLVGHSLPVRPGLDGAGNLYALAHDDDQKAILFRIAPDGQARRLVERGLGDPNAIAVTAEGRILVFGNNTGELRTFDREGKLLRASAAAVDAERDAAESEEEEEDDEES